MTQEPGLRERKKQRTRSLIADSARRLFAERGFDGVTVAEIAREADVSEATVFNYFPTKEDLFYSRLEAFEEELLEAIHRRPPGESVLAAFRGFVLEQRGVLAIEPGRDEEATEQLRTITRVITESPALLARERQVFARYAESLAALLAEETGSAAADVEPRAVATALLGVHRALIDYVRERALAGAPASRSAARSAHTPSGPSRGSSAGSATTPSRPHEADPVASSTASRLDPECWIARQSGRLRRPLWTAMTKAPSGDTLRLSSRSELKGGPDFNVARRIGSQPKKVDGGEGPQRFGVRWRGELIDVVSVVAQKADAARLVHTLEQEGWKVEIADVQKVIGLASLGLQDRQDRLAGPRRPLAPRPGAGDLASRSEGSRETRAREVPPAPGQAKVRAQEPVPRP